MAFARQVSPWQVVLKVVEKHGLWSYTGCGHHSGKGFKSWPWCSVEQTRGSLLPLATEDAIDCPLGMLEEFLRNKGGTVPPNEDEAFG